jgi:hypothetical protein
MWGFGKGGKPIAGVIELYSLVGKDKGPYASDNMVVGYVLRNRLDYIMRSLPSGWEETVQTRATNKIMAQAARKLERDYGIISERLKKAS